MCSSIFRVHTLGIYHSIEFTNSLALNCNFQLIFYQKLIMADSEVHVSSYDSSCDRSLHHVMLPIDEVSVKEQLKLCCKPTYKMRQIKSKGAILVLIWNFLALFVLWYASNSSYRTHIPNNIYNIVATLIPFAIMLPLAGWLADACIGRYRIICCSILILWAAVMLETLSTVVAVILDENDALWNAVLTQALLGLMTGIGLGCFLSTVVQFGIDQLHDASTNEISAFIVWLMWTCTASLFIMNLTFVYLPFNNGRYMLLGNLVLCVNLTLIVIMLFHCNHWLIKEPTLQNPFKLIYQVSKYALKNKHPQYRSAFTYSDDELVSRIDYGKSKYGGPFTTEQVEDVKTFYKTLPIIILGGLLAGEVAAGKFLDNYLKLQFVFVSHSPPVVSELIDGSISSIVSYSIPVLIVLHEVLVYPAFHRCCPWVTSLHKFFMGTLVQIGMFLAFLIFELLSRQNYLKENGYNSTVECVFQNQDQVITTSFTYNWIVIPEALFAISLSLLGIGGLEFIAAQVPYSMKGVLIGVGFCSVIVTVAFSFLSVTVIISPFKLSHWILSTKIISCGFWFELLHIIICSLGCIASVLIIKWYKKRKREDILPNEHFYAERYYSNLLEHRT